MWKSSVRDLRLIEESLLANKGERIARGRLSNLIWSVDVFGFHLASLDIRQHSQRHRHAIAEILAEYDLFADYPALAEPDKVELATARFSTRAHSRPSFSLARKRMRQLPSSG